MWLTCFIKNQLRIEYGWKGAGFLVEVSRKSPLHEGETSLFILGMGTQGDSVRAGEKLREFGMLIASVFFVQ